MKTARGDKQRAQGASRYGRGAFLYTKIKIRGYGVAKERKEKAEKAMGLFKRFVVWLAWQFLRQKCDECPAHYVREYAKVFEARQEKTKKE